MTFTKRLLPSRNTSIVINLRWAQGLALLFLITLAGFTLFQKRADLLAEHQHKTRNLVEAAYTVLEHYEELERLGTLSGADARRDALHVIQSMRYGLAPNEDKSGYFFVLNDQLPIPTMVMHTTRPQLTGTQPTGALYDTATKLQYGLSGTSTALTQPMNYWAALTTVANKAGDGYVTYRGKRPKPGGGVDEVPTPKLSYAKAFTPWHWVLCSGVYIDDIDALFARWASLFAIIIALAGSLLLFISSRMAQTITQPIADAARTMGEIEASGDLTRRAQVIGGPEVAGIATAFNKMLSSFSTVEELSRNLEIARAKAEQARARMTQELDIARALQIAILPNHFPKAPGCLGAARMLPATTMGGDFYDFIELPDGRIGLVMADVSGKGVPAAFFMAVARTNLSNLAAHFSMPGACLAHTNDVLCAQNPMDLFVTVFYGIYDPDTGVLHYANGGHNPPLLRRADGSIEALLGEGGLVLGAMSEMPYADHQVQINPGDRLVLYTDGVTEAFNMADEAYGEAALHAVIAAHGAGDAQTLINEIFSSVAHFAGEAEQSDDITLAVIERNA